MAKSPAWQRKEGKNPSGGLNARRFKETLEALIKKSMVLENSEMYRTVPKAPEVGAA